MFRGSHPCGYPGCLSEVLQAIDVCPFKQSQRTFAVMQNLVQIGYKALRNQIALSGIVYLTHAIVEMLVMNLSMTMLVAPSTPTVLSLLNLSRS